MRSAVSVTDPIEAAGPKAEHVKERNPRMGLRDAAEALAEGQRATRSAIPFIMGSRDATPQANPALNTGR
jgi:hypothetical protein